MPPTCSSAREAPAPGSGDGKRNDLVARQVTGPPRAPRRAASRPVTLRTFATPTTLPPSISPVHLPFPVSLPPFMIFRLLFLPSCCILILFRFPSHQRTSKRVRSI